MQTSCLYQVSPAAIGRYQVACHAQSKKVFSGAATRRNLLGAGTVLLVGLQCQPTFAKREKRTDGMRGPIVAEEYSFLFPATWEPITVPGVDQVYMDVVEQLDNLTIKKAKTDKGSLAELGTPYEVAEDITKRVLVAGNVNDFTISNVEKVERQGYEYYQFRVQSEIETKQSSLGLKKGVQQKVDYCTVAVRDGTIYLFRVGANEKREAQLNKILVTAQNSFNLRELS